jgi:hypothetical protein
MFEEQEYFDITTVNLALELANREIQKTTTEYATLRAFHCIHYKSMTREVRQAVCKMTLELVFGNSELDQLLEELYRTSSKPSTKSTSFLSRVLGSRTDAAD